MDLSELGEKIAKGSSLWFTIETISLHEFSYEIVLRLDNSYVIRNL